jgi:hypothetical protein
MWWLGDAQMYKGVLEVQTWLPVVPQWDHVFDVFRRLSGGVIFAYLFAEESRKGSPSIHLVER